MFVIKEDGKEYLEDRILSLEILDSIKCIDARINELKIVIKHREPRDNNNNNIKMVPRNPSNDRRKWIVKRIERLIKTRFDLVYSYMDVNRNKELTNEEKNTLNPFDYMNTTYQTIKRTI